LPGKISQRLLWRRKQGQGSDGNHEGKCTNSYYHVFLPGVMSWNFTSHVARGITLVSRTPELP
jgi:hypothetical protein